MTTYNAAEKYQATHIDFRSKSEHTVDGRRYDIEMQVVHKADKPATVRRLQEVKEDYQGADTPEFATVSIFFDRASHV